MTANQIPAITTEATANPKNPYSLSNMRKAMASLLMKDIQLMTNNKQQYAQGKVSFSTGTQQLAINKTLTAKESVTLVNKGITTTHYYIKFMPRNDADYAKLKVDSNLIIYPFPLDRATNQYNGSYRDPSVPTGVPTYQYASVPVNYVLPAVPYVKLADLYLPDEQSAQNMVTLKGAGNSSYSVSTQALVDESICNVAVISEIDIEQEEDCATGIGVSGGPDPYRNGENWRPHGRLTMYDEVLKQTIGVEGIKVRARRWFTTYTGISNADGYYIVDGWYTRPANYWLDFERYDFSINNGLGYLYEISGPKIEDAWNVDFTNYDKYVATIFRAAFHYYHKDIQGLHRPPQNSFWARQLKIAAIPDQATSTTNPIRTWFGLGDLIHIRAIGRNSEYVYSTTIHELAHAAHWDNSNASLALSAPTASESWATGVEWALTKMVYPNYGGVFWGANTDYRNVVIDLIDDSSQISYFNRNEYGGFYNNFGFGIVKDQVEGYNIVDIQNALINSPTTWNEWKNNIINNYNNGTEQHVETLFNHWLNY